MPPQPAALPRPARPRRDARQSILASATRLLREDGAQALTMRRVAARSGCSAPTLYHYFRGKTALLDALLEDAFFELVDELARVRPPADPIAALRALCQATVRFCLANPTHFRLMSAARPPQAPPLPSYQEVERRLPAPLVELDAAGRLRMDLDHATQSLWSLVHGLISLQASRSDVAWSPELVSVALDALMHGLVRPARSRR
jgi:AcrR family transcriptional regulator